MKWWIGAVALLALLLATYAVYRTGKLESMVKLRVRPVVARTT